MSNRRGHSSESPPTTTAKSPPDSTNHPTSSALSTLARSHRKWGWWSLFFFATLGFILETLHGFKLGFYLDVSNHTRRLLWTLAHAHGTLLALVHLAWATTLHHWLESQLTPAVRISRCLTSGALLLPTGFFLGGIKIYGGDPGIGIVLVPLGAILILAAIAQIAWNE